MQNKQLVVNQVLLVVDIYSNLPMAAGVMLFVNINVY